jgi:ParB family chromosome partitioning protein
MARLACQSQSRERIKPYTGNDEWYTPAEYIERVRRVLGGIDLDPASNPQAQQIVQAKQYFSKVDDALAQVWRGRVWLNPPYSRGLLIQFVNKLIREIEAGTVSAAVMLLNNFTDASWFQLAQSRSSAFCFPRRRIHFENAPGKKDQPLNGQVFFYYGRDVDLFRSEFSALGITAAGGE